MKEQMEKVRNDAKEFGRKAWEQTKSTASKAGRFVSENKEMVAMGIPLAIATVKAGQSLVVSRRVNKDYHRKDHRLYDPSMGFSWELRRKLTNADRAEIRKRRKAGQDYYEILEELRLLKRR